MSPNTSKTRLVYGYIKSIQATLVYNGDDIAHAFYALSTTPNLVGLITTAKITHMNGTRAFVTLPNGDKGWLESKQKLTAGETLNVRVTAYVTGAKAWPLKISDQSPAPAPTLLERVTALFPLSLVQQDDYAITAWLDNTHGTIPLPDGASLMIESTTAMTTIDINSGRQKNTAALIAQCGPAIARAICTLQLGGIIVIDAVFLSPTARKGLAEKIKKHLADDPLKAKIISVSKMGLIEITRQRLGPSLLEIQRDDQ